MRCRFLLLAAAFVALFSTVASGQERALVLERLEVRPPGGAEEHAVRRLFPLEDGDLLTLESLADAREHLSTSGAFEQLDLYTARGSQRGHVVVVVEAMLDRGAKFQSGFGHDPRDGWFLVLAGLRWHSFFSQPGSMRLGLDFGQRHGGLVADFQRARVAGDSVDLLLRGFTGTRQWIASDNDFDFRQEIRRAQAEAGLRLRMSRRASLTLWGGVEGVDPEENLSEVEGDSTEAVGRLVPVVSGRETLLYSRLDLTFDGRDAPITPRRGLWAGSSFQLGLLDQKTGYVKANADVRGYLPLPSSGASLGFRAAGHYTSPNTPYYERLVFGGNGTVRGFRDGSLSGPLGARAAWMAATEARVPLVGQDKPLPTVTGILFAEVGQPWDSQGQSVDPAVGVGYGLRLRIPWVQIFGIDVGIPLTDTSTNDAFWIHATLGHSF